MCEAVEAKDADSLVPLLIQLVVEASPRHVHSNLQFIMQYATEGDACVHFGAEQVEYCLTSFMAAVSFVESAGASSFPGVSLAEFQRYP